MKNMKGKLVILIALAAIVAACNPSKDNSFEDGVLARGERYEANCAYAYKYSGPTVNGCDSYGLSLFRGNVGEDLYLEGKGMELYLDVLCPQSSALDFPAGTYKAVLKYDGSNPAFMLSTGCVSDGIVYGSYMEFVPSEVADPEYFVLTDGTVTVGKRGGTYVIEASVIVGGVSMVFSYSGPVETLEITGDGDGDEAETGMDYTFSNFTQGELDYFGPDGGLYYWGIYLGDAQADLGQLSSDGSVLCLELSTKNASSTDIQPGTYTVSSKDGDMVAAAIYENEDGGYAGTMYCLEDFIVVGATSGTVKVSKSGSNYTVEVDLYDADFDNTFRGSYTGPLTYVDYTKENRAVKVRGTSKNIAREGKRHYAVRGRV